MKKVNKVMTKSQKQLLIAMLIGDGTICSNGVYKLAHAIEQEEYLRGKISRLDALGIKHSALKYYTSSCGYNVDKQVCYAQLSCHSTIHALRRAVYRPKKTISANLLSGLTKEGLAIWYMDDGMLNLNESTQRYSTQYTIRIATCVDESTAKEICKYLLNTGKVHFHTFKEREGLYSIMSCAKQDCIDFLTIVKPYVEQVPSMMYKLRKHGTKENFISLQKQGSKCETLV